MSIEYEVKYLHVIGLYSTCFRNYIVGIGILKIKRVVDMQSQFITNIWKHLLNKTSIKSSGKCFRQQVSVFQQLDHLNKIGLEKKLDKWVPHEFIENQRAGHFEMCLMLFLQNSNDCNIWWEIDPVKPCKLPPLILSRKVFC